MKTSKLAKIAEAIRLCKEQDRNPICILMNRDIRDIIIDNVIWVSTPNEEIDFPSLFGLPIILFDVTDFLIIDDRCWFEQIF